MTAVTQPTTPQNPAFAALKAGLDARTGGGGRAPADADALASGLPDLDRALAGGFPRGTVATLEGNGSCGRTALLAATLANVTARAFAAIIDPDEASGAGCFYPPDVERAGVLLDHTLFVQANKPLEVARCADILLRTRAFAAIVMPMTSLRAAVWSRLCGLAHKSGSVLFVLGMQANTELAYFASTRVRLGIDRVAWADTGVLGELHGYEVRAQVLKHRRAAPGQVAHVHVARAAY